VDNKILDVTPLKDGLFKIGNNDIYCTYPLLGTIIDLEHHKITYNYAPYKIEVTWTETTEGTRTNPSWRRVYNS
jgi:hypothetical protein